MSAEQDDTEFRDCWGMPRVDGPITRPRAYVTGGSAPLTSSIHQSTDNSVNRPMPWIALSMLIAGIASGVSAWAINAAQTAERETRMLEYYLLELDAKVIAAGIKPSSESISKKLEQEHKQ